MKCSVCGTVKKYNKETKWYYCPRCEKDTEGSVARVQERLEQFKKEVVGRSTSE